MGTKVFFFAGGIYARYDKPDARVDAGPLPIAGSTHCALISRPVGIYYPLPTASIEDSQKGPARLSVKVNQVMNFGILTFLTDETLVMSKTQDQSGRPQARCRCLRG